MNKLCTASGYNLISMFTPPHNTVQRIYDEWDIPINVHE